VTLATATAMLTRAAANSDQTIRTAILPAIAAPPSGPSLSLAMTEAGGRGQTLILPVPARDGARRDR
jgi:hypothetical protein